MAAVPNSKPISAELTERLAQAGPFERCPTLAVAVSGGADSMALLLLTDEWARAHSGRVVVLTVDHGLRCESTAEARQVAGWCRTRNIEHHILKVQGSGFGIQDSGSIQAQAREARYQLLASWCRRHGVLYLLTAHTENDQAETLFFRLARGSFIDGLACMPLVSVTQGVRLIRPLLNIRKQDLIELLRTRGQGWINDPSNADPRYTRTHIRQALRDKTNLIEHTAQLASRFGNIRKQLESNIVSYMANAVSIFPEAYATIDLNAFRVLPDEAGLRLLGALAMTLAGAPYPARSRKLERLLEDLRQELPMRRSFGGLLFIRKPRMNAVLVCREPNAMEGPRTLPQGADATWDGRFHIAWTSAALHDALTVRALGAEGIARLDPTPCLDKTALAALPSFWHLEHLVAAPHIPYRNPAFARLTCSAAFRPAKALAGQAFYGMNSKPLT